MKTKQVLVTLLLGSASVMGQAADVLLTTNSTPQTDLAGLPPRVHNRQVTSFTEGHREALRFDERSGDGLAWWPDTKLADATIEFDVRGKDVFQKSFVGVAFHGVDEKTYDAVYFRPFNFRATDPARRNHAVQYVALPTYDWLMNTSSNTEPTIIRREQFLVMGTLTRITPGTESGEKFASIWKDFEAHHEQIKAHSTDQKYYGVSFGAADAGRIDYVAGMAISPVQAIPAGLVLRAVPAATYAVFACPVAAIGATYRYIFGEWRSASSYQVDDSAPAFEQYPSASETNSPVLIHIPVRKKRAK